MRQDVLSKIDKYFDAKKQSETNIIFLGSALIIIYIVYMLCFDPSQDFYDERLNTHTKISNDLSRTRDYLRSTSSPSGDKNF